MPDGEGSLSYSYARYFMATSDSAVLDRDIEYEPRERMSEAPLDNHRPGPYIRWHP